ncbi:MAG TPA: class I SAM-dependent methyltransferase [Gammaproteobacteria bacterium]|nr:class I SAM-dependent methyltransferase [Gammaproteobacteria bacterium]
MQENFLPKVKQQYESLPYPPREPIDEKQRLIHTECDRLDKIMHYCFQGINRFDKNFRCLVAGGGTGDAAIFLAEQLKNYGAKVTYLDLSESSMAIAKERAQVRGLNNIEWINGSILDLSAFNVEPFDYINCSGVLHHLASPEEGLISLTNNLKADGAIGLMLYAKYGRQEVYNMQNLLRDILPDGASIEDKLFLTRVIVNNLPDTNLFKQNLSKWAIDLSKKAYGDAGVYDLLLHSKDRCYTVDELYDLAKAANLNFVNFVGPFKQYYNLDTIDISEKVKDIFSTFGLRKKQAVAEQWHGNITKHMFYLSKRENAEANIEDKSLALLFTGDLAGKGHEFYQTIKPGEHLVLTYSLGDEKEEFGLECNRLTKDVVKLIDGKTSQQNIIRKIQKSHPNYSSNDVISEINKIFNLLHPRGWICLYRN